MPARLNGASVRGTLGVVSDCFIGFGGVALLALLGSLFKLKSSTEGFLFLLFVVVVAVTTGFWQATAVSILAALCLDYFFLPPVYVLTIADPQDWIALGAFESSALIVSWLSSEEQMNAREAQSQRAAVEQLYELCRSTLLLNLHEAPGPQLVHLIYRIFQVEAVGLFDAKLGRLDKTGSWLEDEQELARECYMLNVAHEDRFTHTSQRLLRLGGVTIGALAVRGEVSHQVVDAVESLAAISLERFHSFQKESRAEAAQRSEQLRTAVLDSLAHAFKTPLTAIHAAGSGLLEMDGLNPAQLELVTLIEEESVSLSQLCTRLLQTARLEAEQVSVEKEQVCITQLISAAASKQFARAFAHRVKISISDPTLAVYGDPELLTTILVQYMDNAVKYSTPGSPIVISAQASQTEVIISVHNTGSTIRMEDRDRIFNRFYRCPETRRVADGTGIGLSVVKKAAEANRGHVWMISEETEGTTFYLSLPQASRGNI